MKEPPVSAASRRSSSGSAFESTGWPFPSLLKPVVRPAGVEVRDRGPGSVQGADEDRVHRDALGLRARDRGVHAALEVLAVREDDDVLAARRAGREQIGRGREPGGDRRPGLRPHARLHRVEEQADRRGVERERHEGLGLALAGDERRAIASEPREEGLSGLPGEDEARG